AAGGLATLAPEPPPTGTVGRDLPGTYRADTGFTVTLAVTPEAGVEFYTVEETVPSGWAVTTASHAGSSAAGTIRWGPFVDAEARALSYFVQAPVGAATNAVFRGAGSFGATTVPTAGDTNVAPAPLAGGSAVRALPVNFRPGTPFAAAIELAPYSNTLFCAVAETLPAGWAVSNISHDGFFSAARQQIKWGPFLDSTPRTLTCDLTPPGHATGVVVFTGQAQFDTVSVEIAGDTQTVARLPGGGTIARQLPSYYLPPQTLAVSLTVTPVAGVSAQGIEDVYPAGWSIDPATVSAGGLVLPAESKVRWLFLDEEPRVLTYVLTPASGALGEARFAGQGTFDAARVTTGGATNLFRKPGGTATRSLPGFFFPGLSLPVGLNVLADSSVVFLTVVDTPPAGWRVDSISHGGSFDATNGTVRWILDAGASPMALTYRVWSPAAITNSVQFAGTIACDGLAAPVAGATNLRPNLLVLVCAGNKTVEYGSAWSFDPPGVADDCPQANITVSILGTVTNGAWPAVLTRTWLAVDGCGNSNTCSQGVTLQDTTAPVITFTGANPLTNECHLAFSDPGATANDTRDGNVAVSANSTVNSNAVGVYQIPYTATDACGNAATNTRTVYVLDRTAPVLTLAGSNPMTNECHAAFSDPGATASDTCAGSLAVSTNSTVNAEVVGLYRITYTVTDPSGNAATNTRTVYVVKAPARVELSGLSQTYTGTGHALTTATTPANLAVVVTYNGVTTLPVAAGNYTVIATVDDASYFGGATNTLTVNPAAATVTLGNLSQTYNGTARSVAVTTDPASLAVSVTYDGSALAPTNAGSRAAVAIVTD
ncbi:MAG: MBG domain-containing protein, partial [Verrucomicrobiota bacterium]